MAVSDKRAKLFMKIPNPTYLLWLEEWLREAKERNQPKRIRDLTLAIESLKKYPVRLNSAKECIILENFSRQLVDEIEVRENRRGEAIYATKNPPKPSVAVASPTKIQKFEVEPDSHLKTSKHASISGPGELSKPKPCESLSPSKVSKPKSPSIAREPKPKASSPAKALSLATSPTKASHCSSSVSNTALDEESHRKQLSLVEDLVAPSKTTQKSRRKVHSQDDSGEAMDSQQPPAPSETLIFPPGSFQIILLIDTGEKGFLSSVSNFSDPDFRHEVRHLKVGDYAWIARGPSQKELLLPFLVERKRLDDLSKSVKDGRFSEQKFRLKMSNIPNIIYLIENHDVRGNTQSIIQGISNMLIKDLFTLKETRDNEDAMRYLVNFTRYLSLTVTGKTLMSSVEYDPECGIQSDLVRLPEFAFFFAGMGKLRTFTTKEMFTKQLVQLHGMSADKAWAIVTKYQTPKALIEAFRASGPSLLADITYGLLNRKLGQNISSVLFKFYTSMDFQ